MKIRFYIYASCVALVLCSFAGGPEVAETGSARKAACEIPESVELIPTLRDCTSVVIRGELLTMVRWPSDETAKCDKRLVDRSQAIPAVYPPGYPRGKPLRLGAMAPSAACKEAEQWIRRVLRPEWVPDDLGRRLVALQRDPASRSTIVCRYEMSGHAIQINQIRTVMCVVIRPSESIGMGSKPAEFGPVIFRSYFTDGKQMAAVKAIPIRAPSPLHAYMQHPSEFLAPDGTRKRGWAFWYTDGKAVAVFIVKVLGSMRLIMLDRPDPYF